LIVELLSGERAIYISAVHTLRDVEFLMKINLEFDVEPYVKGGGSLHLWMHMTF